MQVSSPLGAPSGGVTISYLLRDEFTTPEVAPLTSPRTCEPGPGQLLIIDTGVKSSISSGDYISGSLTVPPAAPPDPGVVSSIAFTRSIGLCGLTRWKYSGGSDQRWVIGWWLNQLMSSQDETISTLLNKYRYRSQFLLLIDDAPITNYDKTYVILRNPGAILVIDQTIVWVSVSSIGTPLYYGCSTDNQLSVGANIDYMRVAQLSGPWLDNYGVVTQRTASAGAGASITSEANAIIEATWQAVTGETYELSTRRTDDDNRWIVRGDQAGSTIKLIERNAGVETERSSAVQTWTNGVSYRIVVIQDGNTIYTTVNNVAKNTYTSATFNNTATGIKTSHAVTNLIAWPRTLSGSALSALVAI